MHEDLISTMVAFGSPSSKLLWDEPYQNRHGRWGRYLLLWHGEHYHMLSISNCVSSPSPSQIAEIFKSVTDIDDSKRGFYDNKHGALGYYATFKSEHSFDDSEHWYMLARSNDRKTLYKMREDGRATAEMLDMIDFLERNPDARNIAG
jgi:hypothetical protein